MYPLWASALGLALTAAASPSIRVARDNPSATLNARQASGTNLALKRDWNIDANNVEQLGLKKSARMLWTLESVPLGDSPDVDNEPYAWMEMPSTKYPILQTSNTDHIGDIQCGNGKIRMQFKDWKAYDWAWNNWEENSNDNGEYVVITSEPSCKNWQDDAAANWLKATSAERDDGSLTITCTVEDIQFGDAVGDEPIKVQFENFNQNEVDVQANENPGSDGFEDQGGEIMADPSGDTTFDDYLDWMLGTMTQESFDASTLNEFDMTYEDFIVDSDLPDLAQENLIVKRRIGDKIKKAVKKIKKVVKAVVKVVAPVIKKVAEVVVEAVKVVEQAIADFTTISRDFSRDINVNTETIGQIVETPFDNRLGYELFSGTAEDDLVSGSIDVFCVDCFVKTDLKLAGEIEFIVSRLDLEKGFITLKGSASAGLGLGIAAELAFSKEVKKQIASIPLTPFVIPGIFTLGPKVDVSVGATFSMTLEGSALAGVRLDWPTIDARADFNGGSFANGFTPVVTPVVEIEGEIEIEGSIFIEDSFGFGLDIGNGLFDASLALLLRDSIFLTASLGAAFDLENGGGFSTGDDECPGLQLVTALGVDVSIDIFGIIEESLFSERLALDTRCFDFGRKRDTVPALSGRSKKNMVPALPRRKKPYHHETRAASGTIGDTTFPGGRMSEMFTRDGDKSFRLRYSPNGNTYAVSSNKVPDSDQEWSGWFSADTNNAFIYGDSHGRFYHGYKDTLDSLGVSRLRLHASDSMPKPAWPMVWAAVVDEEEAEEDSNIESDMPVLMVSDLAGDVYFPVHCLYESEKVYGKIFIVKDLDHGLETLMSNSAEVMKTVTGDPIRECGYVAITNGLRGVDIDEDVADEGKEASCAGVLEQCGGTWFTGPACCSSGSWCQFQTEAYSECVGEISRRHLAWSR